jgi:hypothetical protein
MLFNANQVKGKRKNFAGETAKDMPKCPYPDSRYL